MGGNGGLFTCTSMWLGECIYMIIRSCISLIPKTEKGQRRKMKEKKNVTNIQLTLSRIMAAFAKKDGGKTCSSVVGFKQKTLFV